MPNIAERINPIWVRFVSSTRVDGRIPPELDTSDAEAMERAGFATLVQTPMPTQDPAPHHHYERRYERLQGHVLQSWTAVANNPREFSKRRLYRALEAAGVWTQVEAYMEQSGVLKDWDYATTLDENDPLLVAAVEALKTQLGLTDEQVEAILAASVAEGI